MTKRSLVLLTCANGYFAQRDNVWDSMDTRRLTELFVNEQFDVRHHDYEAVAKNLGLVQNAIVLYSSSQKPGYKDYLEDVLIGLRHFNNWLIPNFDLFRAHENKGYQEILRQALGISGLSGQYFSHTADALKQNLSFPVVYKSPTGSMSREVALIRRPRDLIKRASAKEKLPIYWTVHGILHRYFLKRTHVPGWYDHLTPFHRFVLQTFEADLTHDYKVLVFGRKYFVLKRAVRSGDFRASGSGRFAFVDPPPDLLAYANEIFNRFDTPFLSMDICRSAADYGLIEFQGVSFGPYTLTHAPFHYVIERGSWRKVLGTTRLEDEYAAATTAFIRDRSGDA